MNFLIHVLGSGLRGVWRPRPDAMIVHANGCGLLLVEVYSASGAPDRWRLLVQLIAYARVIRPLLNNVEAPNRLSKFCPLGIYVTRDGVVNVFLAHAQRVRVLFSPGVVLEQVHSTIGFHRDHASTRFRSKEDR